MRRCSPSLWTMCYLRNLSTINAIKLTSNHLWIFKLCVVRQIFPHTSNYFWIFKLCVVHQTFPPSLQLTYHPIICEFSNCAFFAKSFHHHCNWLTIQSFVNFQIVRFSPNLSTFIAIDLFVNFQNVCCSTNLSTYIAINLSSNHFRIFEWCVIREIFPQSMQLTYLPTICEISNCVLFAKSFHIHCN